MSMIKYSSLYKYLNTFLSVIALVIIYTFVQVFYTCISIDFGEYCAHPSSYT